MNKKSKFIVGMVSVAAVAGLAVAAKCYLGGCAYRRHAVLSSETKYSLASELVRIVREEDGAVLRQWLLDQQPWASGQVVLSLDNNFDPASRVRLATLSAIYSLDSVGLSSEARKGWALVLRDLARAMLHPGAMRSDYVAKSYLMEGRLAEAASEYRLIPDYPTAKVFFEQNPHFLAPKHDRAPASN